MWSRAHHWVFFINAALNYAGGGYCNSIVADVNGVDRSKLSAGPAYQPPERANFALGDYPGYCDKAKHPIGTLLERVSMGQLKSVVFLN